MNKRFQGLEKFRFKVTGIGTFGKPRRPRVIWAGTAECPPLMELQQKTLKALRAAEIDYDEKPFFPHLTLGRIRSSKNISGLLELLEKEKETDFGSVEVTDAYLMKSDLKPTGAEHTRLFCIPLS